MTDPRALPCILLERADDFIKTMKFFIDEQRHPRYVAIRTHTRYPSPGHQTFGVSARFIAPPGERGDVPVMVIYELPADPDGMEYAEKIRFACRDWKVFIVPGLMTQADPAGDAMQSAAVDPRA